MTQAKRPSDFFTETPQAKRPEKKILKENKEFFYVPPSKASGPIFEGRKDGVSELESRLKSSGETSWKGIDRIMKSISRYFGITPTELHHKFKEKHGMIPDDWVKKNSNDH